MYDFGHEFENSTIAICLQDPGFVPQHNDVLSAEYFTKPEARVAVDAILRFWEQHRAVPSLHSMSVFLRGDENANEIMSYLRECEKNPTHDAPFIKDRVIDFARHRAVEEALFKCADFLKDGDYENIGREVMRSLAVGMGDDKEGYLYFDETVQRLKSYTDGREADPNVVSTGIPELDDCLDGGGLWKGELGLIQAPAGVGKTSVLMNLGYGALIQGLRVTHITLEVSGVKTARRYDMRVTGMTKEKLMAKKRTAAQRILGMCRELKCGLDIKQFATKTATCRDLSAYIQKRWEADRFRPDLLIVDYGEILAPERKLDDRWIEIDESYEALRALGQQWGCPVWTGSQTNKDAIGRRKSGIEHTGGSYGKIKTADVVISLNPEARSVAQAVVPLTMCGIKNREEKSGWEVLCNFNRETQTVVAR